MAFLGNVEYIPDDSGVAMSVKCPLVEDWIDPIDCMENQSIREESIPIRFREKQNWKELCKTCPFRNY